MGDLDVIKVMISGSHKEGFRLNGSDIDFMACYRSRVIWNFAQSQFYNIQRQGMILCDSSESPPDSLYFCYQRKKVLYCEPVLRYMGDFT